MLQANLFQQGHHMLKVLYPQKILDHLFQIQEICMGGSQKRLRLRRFLQIVVKLLDPMGYPAMTGLDHQKILLQ
jgi:hypothetical protein